MLDSQWLIGPPKWPHEKERDRMYLATTYVRYQRDQLLLVALNALNRHRNQIDFGIPPSLSQLEVNEVAAYAQALRNVPQQKGFPYELAWPTAPACLKSKVIG